MKIPALISVFSLAMFTATFAADKSNDTRELQGSWSPVEAQLRGAPMKKEVLKIITLKLQEGGRYEVTAENVDKGTYTLDPAAKPKAITITGVDGPNAGKTIPAIYEIHGDTLRICYNLAGGARPTEFKSPSGTNIFLVTYKRKKE
jgi:uncharacterized protein (TIGR03067 family)